MNSVTVSYKSLILKGLLRPGTAMSRKAVAKKKAPKKKIGCATQAGREDRLRKYDKALVERGSITCGSTPKW